MDETIAAPAYRTGRGDRAIPLAVFFLDLAAAPLVAWASGPFLWPWGGAAAGALVGLAALALGRWFRALETVRWDPVAGTLAFCRPGRQTVVAVGALDRLTVVPSDARTLLGLGGRTMVLSHRLVRVESLLDALRARRPDLAPPPPTTFPTSPATVVVLLLLASGTVLAGWWLWPWQPAVGIGFVVCGALVALRTLWSVPLAFRLGPGELTVRYAFRRRTWRGPTAVRPEQYAAAGVQFFRLRVFFGRRQLVLDEAVLAVPLRPWATWVTDHLVPPNLV